MDDAAHLIIVCCLVFIMTIIPLHLVHLMLRISIHCSQHSRQQKRCQIMCEEINAIPIINHSFDRQLNFYCETSLAWWFTLMRRWKALSLLGNHFCFHTPRVHIDFFCLLQRLLFIHFCLFISHGLTSSRVESSRGRWKIENSLDAHSGIACWFN